MLAYLKVSFTRFWLNTFNFDTFVTVILIAKYIYVRMIFRICRPELHVFKDLVVYRFQVENHIATSVVGLEKSVIPQSPSCQTSGYPFIYVIIYNDIRFSTSIVLPRSRFTPLKSMEEGRS